SVPSAWSSLTIVLRVMMVHPALERALTSSPLVRFWYTGSRGRSIGPRVRAASVGGRARLKSARRIPPAPRRGRATHEQYCVRCGVPGLDEDSLCRQCGETLAPAGYCSVCESHWTLAPGTPCPKHDLELEILAPGTGASSGRSSLIDGPWVTVGQFADALRAE